MAKIRDLLATGNTLSFEFFPPKTDEGVRGLEKTLHELVPLRPSFVSVTYGAGGSGEGHYTRDLVIDLNNTHDFPAMAHLTCMTHTRAEIKALLADYRESGVENILALAGDPPADGSTPRGEFRYASELVDVIRESGDFCVGVAAFPEIHPRSEHTADDRAALAAKLRSADFGVTQFFFDVEPYLRMVEDLGRLGCTTPVLPGVMPVLNPATVRRFATMNASRVPPGLFAKLEDADADDRLAIAVDNATELAQRLLDEGVPGLHLYALNRSEAVTQIVNNLGLA